MAMFLEDILQERLGQSVSDLLMSADRIDLDLSRTHVFPEMVITHVNVLGTRAKLWQTCQLQGSRIVFKNLAIHLWRSTDYLKTPLLHFFEQEHDGKHVSKGHGKGNLLGLCCGQCNL